MIREDTHPVALLSAFADRETTASERGTIAAHLAGCEACRALLEDFRLVDRALADEPAPPVPAELAARIQERLGAPERSPASGLPPRVPAPRVAARWSRRLPLAAAASLILASLLWLLRLEPPHRDETPGPLPAVDRIAEAAHAQALPPPPPPAPESPPGTAGGIAPRRAEAKRPPPRAAAESSRARDAAGLRADAPASEKERAAETVPPRAVAEPLRALGYIASGPVGGQRDEESGTPAVEAPPYRVRLLANRSMSVETAGYTCVVPVSEEDAVSLAAIVSAAQIRQERTVKAASQAAPAAAPSPSADIAGPVAGAPKAAMVSQRVCADLSPDDCRFVLALVRERYRLPIAARCGAPPR